GDCALVRGGRLRRRKGSFEANGDDGDVVNGNGTVRKAVDVCVESLAYGLDALPLGSILLHEGQPCQNTLKAVELLRHVLGLGDAIRDQDQYITWWQLHLPH